MIDTGLHLGSVVTLVVAVAACSGSDGNADQKSSLGGAATATGGVGNANGGAGNANGGVTTATSTDVGTAVATGGTTIQVAAGGTTTRGATSATVNTGGSGVAAGTTSRGGTAITSVGGASGSSTVTTPNTIDCRKEGDNKTTLVFINHCSKTVTYRGSDITGGTVAAGAFACVDIGNTTDAISSKRYWGWIGTDPGAGRYSLAEFTFNTDFHDLDWYNISYVDASNLPLAILPAERPKCKQMICPEDFVAACPSVGQYRDASGNVVSCVNPGRDDPNNPVAQLFEQCDDAYAWSGDDQKGTDPSPMIGCEVEDFDIVFCPGGVP